MVAKGRVEGGGLGRGDWGTGEWVKKLSAMELSLILYPTFSVRHF